MKIGAYEIANKWLVIPVALLVAVLIFIFLSIPSCQKPITPQQTIGEVKAELEKQYNDQLATKETQIMDYKARLTISEGRYAGMVAKYIELEKRKRDVPKPTTNKEIRDRFTTLGYVPLAVK